MLFQPDEILANWLTVSKIVSGDSIPSDMGAKCLNKLRKAIPTLPSDLNNSCPEGVLNIISPQPSVMDDFISSIKLPILYGAVDSRDTAGSSLNTAFSRLLIPQEVTPSANLSLHSGSSGSMSNPINSETV